MGAVLDRRDNHGKSGNCLVGSFLDGGCVCSVEECKKKGRLGGCLQDVEGKAAPRYTATDQAFPAIVCETGTYQDRMDVCK